MEGRVRVPASTATGAKAKTRTRDASKTKADLLDLLAKGHSVERACDALKVTRGTYNYHRSADPGFKAQADAILARAKGDHTANVQAGRPEVPDFPEFCEMLGMSLFPHQLQWFDILEGREPRDLHESMQWEPGDPDLLVVNTPPFHAKSMTITIMYATWRIYCDPNVRILIVSKAQRLAEAFLLAIKQRLTHPKFQPLWAKYGPPGGWDNNSQSWKQNLFYVSDDVRDPEEKDPTCQALGIGGAIYGARADLIILDDCVDNGNAHEFEKQKHWVETEVLSRVPDGGKLIVVGTRMAPKDLYSALLEDSGADDFEEGDRWTYFAQPAVLEYADNPEDWQTLWPRTNMPPDKKGTHSPGPDGMFPMWDGPRLRKRRSKMDPARWSRVFMQHAVAEDQTFQPTDVTACQQGRQPGIIPDDPALGRRGGMSGLYVVAGLDPAAGGFTAMTVLGVDRIAGMRHVIDVWNKKAATMAEIVDTVKDFTTRYGIREWRVEDNAFQHHFATDPDITAWMAARGVIWSSHTTGKNKHDAELGVAAMSGLFKNRLVTLPRTSKESVRAMIEQLTTWAPKLPKSQKTDVVMSLWFAELRAITLLGQSLGSDSPFSDSRYVSRWGKRQQRVVDLTQLEAEQADQYVWA
jgi:hypothetical protein